MSSRRYKEALKLCDQNKAYSIEEAIEVFQSMPRTKFDETVEISGKLGIDPKQSDQMVRGSVVLPHGIGKDVRVLVFCDPEKESEAKEAGADYIGSEETISKILNDGWIEFDCCVASPSMMRLVSKLGRFLGPRGLMPSPKTGTVTENISYAVKEAKRGKIDFRLDKFGCIHAGIGKISFDASALIENVKVFIDALAAARPQSVKGDFIGSLYLSKTMGPSVKISL